MKANIRGSLINSGNYTLVANSLLKRNDISINARLLYILVSSNRDGFDPSLGYLAKQIGIDIKTLRKAKRELISNNMARYFPPAKKGQKGRLIVLEEKRWISSNQGKSSHIDGHSLGEKIPDNQGKISLTSQGENPILQEDKKRVRGEITPDEFMTIWNLNKGDLPPCHKMTLTRAKYATKLLKQYPDENYWMEIIKRASHSDYLTGRKKGGDGWRLSIDYFIEKKDLHIRIGEGQYDNANNNLTNDFVLAKPEDVET